MPISCGTRLGPYEIVALIGAGGMGEVYGARDPRMGREVAIKVSAERFSDRFEREVRAVAALNHPNICHIYDVGPNYLVMELVEGPTLADRIRQGAIALEQALAIARQIADALEAAHEKGIVHRDLKPANIKIKTDGAVKVLDFGLAKIAEPPAGSPESSPTVAMGATVAGQILGTAAYMSPEQARGKVVDERADIWAFGVVLYEMLAGRRLFEGETISDTLAGVLTKEPDWSRVPAKTQRLLKGCLEKDPKRRLRDIADAWRLLEDGPAPAARSGVVWKIAAAVLLLVSLTLGVLWRTTRRVAITSSPVHLDLDLGADVSFGSSTGPAVILSPDGTRLVFVSQAHDGMSHLFTRRLDQPQTTLLAKTEGAYEPFFSPDGLWVGFFAQGKLKKTRIDGGEPISLCDAPAGRGASWSENGDIIASLDVQVGLSLIPADGGKVIPLTELGQLGLGDDVTHRWPQVLPGGKAVLFTADNAYGNFEGTGIAAISLQDRREKVVFEHAGMYPRYLPTGHLVYVTRGALFAVPFDPKRLEVRGPATQLEEVSNDTTIGSAQVDFSRTGTLAYRTGSNQGLRSIQWLDSAGKAEPLGYEPGVEIFPRLSPDGSRLALVMNHGWDADIWVYDLQRGNKTRLTSGTGVNAYPVWSPDGRFLVFKSVGGMVWTRADGAGKPQPLTRSKAVQFPTSFSPDGTRLVFSELIPGAGPEIRTVPVRSESGQLRVGEPEVFLKTSTVYVFAVFSRDGRWIAYSNAEGGRYEVYVRAFPDKGAQVQISNAGGVMPLWSRNGHELFYRTEDQRITVANYAVKGDAFVADKPRFWTGKRLANTGLAANLDLAPDGKRLVVLMPAEGTQPRESQSHVILVVNFFDEVRRRMGGQAK